MAIPVANWDTDGHTDGHTIPMAIPVAIPYHGNARCRSVPITDRGPWPFRTTESHMTF